MDTIADEYENSATEQEIRSVTAFSLFSSHRNIEYLQDAIVHGISAIKATPSDRHPRHVAGRMLARLGENLGLVHVPTAINQAASKGLTELLDLLLVLGASQGLGADVTQSMPLQLATINGHEAAVRLLLDKTADENNGSGMQNDTSVCLGHAANGRLLEHIERAQQIMFHESETQHWVRNLCFVVQAENADDSDYDLELIESSGGDEETKNELYIAVSYCWASNTNKEETPLRIQVPLKDQRGSKEIRDVRAPSNILHQSLTYAAARGIKKIWIDQECVRQDDEEDKKIAIQCMHLVYRRAAVTLIVLGDHIQTLEDARAIPYIKEFGVNEDLRDRILCDRWFTRAWTTQEYANSARERLSYLIGWKEGVDITGDTWQLEATAFKARGEHPQQIVRRAWELDHSQMFAISFMSMHHTQVMQSMTASCQWAGFAPNQRTFRLLDQDIEAEDER